MVRIDHPELSDRARVLHETDHTEWMPPPKPATRPPCDCALCRSPAVVWSYGPHAGERYDAG
jgi:hypothetical protein